LPKLIMLDFDGVIADSLDLTHSATVSAFQSAGLGHLVSDDLVLRLVDLNWFDALRAMDVPTQVVDDIDMRVAGLVEAGRMRPYDGIAEVISTLSLQHRTVVVTSNRSDIVEAFLSQWDILGVSEILGGDKGQSKVPKLRLSARRNPCLEPWFIGDSMGDMLEGRAAGVTTVGAVWGWHSERQLLSCSPNHLAHTPRDLQLLLG